LSMSKHPETDTPSEDTAQAEQPVETTPPPHRLQRETILIAADRTRLALVVALCTLTGVGVGFGLSTMTTHSARCGSHAAVQRVAAHAPRIAVAGADVTWLGVEVRSLGAWNGSQPGALITGVFPGSPAASAGLETGDLILAMQGQQIQSSQALVRTVRSFQANTHVLIDVRRANGENETIRTKLSSIDVDLLSSRNYRSNLSRR
jgi:membrane-associated protease RseP (regulator of RpoE activity)